jgi:thiol-disulfide isomerase/thioredoxin
LLKSKLNLKRMQSIFGKLIVLFLIFAIAALLGCGETTEKKDLNPGFDFDLPDLNGKIASLGDFRGKVLVINFWATWCPPCEEEILKLNQLHKEYKNKGLVVIGIALDKDSLNLVEPFIREKRVGYLILRGNEQVLGAVKDFSGVPTTLIVDQKGNIHKKYDGSFDEEDLENNLKELLY